MNITRNQKRETELLSGLDLPILTGIHLTSLIGCLRAAYYQQVSPAPPTRKMKLYSLTGNGFQERIYQGNNCTDELLVPIAGVNIHTMPDNVVDHVDCKSTRKYIQSELNDEWLTQIAFYAWVCGRLSWGVDALYVGFSAPKKKDKPDYAPPDIEAYAPELICYTVDFEEWEIEERVNYILDRCEELVQRLRMKCLPPQEKSWRCKECSHAFACDLDTSSMVGGFNNAIYS